MYQIDSETLNLIKRSCKGKKYIKLTIGLLEGKDTMLKVYDESGEIAPGPAYTYEIGSITKTFTASLLSKFVFENKMSLNDSIKKYIPGLDIEQYFPTLHRIATHTSGYSSAFPLNNREYIGLYLDLIFTGKIQKVNPLNMDLDKMSMLVKKSKLEDADYKWKYSNFGLSLLGYAIGTVSGKAYWDTMNDFLLNELGLENTYLGTFSDKNLHGFNAKNVECGNWCWDEKNLVAPAGAISSTAEDLLKYAWLNMFEEKPYLQLCHKKHANASKKYDMGLAWWLHRNNNNIIMHGGGTGCFSSFLVIDKEKKAAAVVLANYRLGIDLDQKIGLSLLEDLKRSN